MVNDGALLGFPEVMAAIGERMAREAYAAEVEANKLQCRLEQVVIWEPHEATIYFAFDAYYECHHDWETGIVDDANLILKLKGVVDLAKVPVIKCPELAER